MNLYQKNIRKIIDERIFVVIFVDLFSTSAMGYIVRVSDDLLLLEAYSETGNFDGVKIFRLDDVTRIRWGSLELKTIESFVKPVEQNNTLGKIAIDSIKSSIEDLQHMFGYVVIHTQSLNKNVCFIGEIAEIDDGDLVMNEFGPISSQGRGFLFLSLQDITRIDTEGAYEKKLSTFYKSVEEQGTEQGKVTDLGSE